MNWYDELKFIGKSGFNIGAFLLTPIWCLFHGQIGIGAILCVFLITPQVFPLPGIIKTIFYLIILIASFYFGFKGNKIAMESGRYKSDKEMLFMQKRWAF